MLPVGPTVRTVLVHTDLPLGGLQQWPKAVAAGAAGPRKHRNDLPLKVLVPVGRHLGILFTVRRLESK